MSRNPIRLDSYEVRADAATDLVEADTLETGR